MTNLNTNFKSTDDTTKDFCVFFWSIKQYPGELYYDTRKEAQEMLDTMTDESIIWAKIVYMPEFKVVAEFENPFPAPVLTKTKAVEPSWVNTVDGLSPSAEVDYSNFDSTERRDKERVQSSLTASLEGMSKLTQHLRKA